MNADTKPHEEANRLFVEAALLVKQSDESAETDIETAYSKGRKALENIDKLFSEYAETNIAVDMILGRAIFDLETIKRIRARVEQYHTIVNSMESPKKFLLFLVPIITKQELCCDMNMLAWALAKADCLEIALDVARESGMSALIEVVQVLGNKGDRSKAKEILEYTLETINENYVDYEESKDNPCSPVAIELAKLGEIEKAINLVSEKILEPESKSKTLYRIACAIARAGDFDRAVGLVDQIEKLDLKAIALRDMAIMTENKDQRNNLIRHALEVAGQIRYDFSQAQVHQSIVETLVKVGDTEQALSIARKIPNQFSARDYALEAVILAVSKNESDLNAYHRALGLLREVHHPIINIRLLSQLVQANKCADDADDGYGLLRGAFWDARLKNDLVGQWAWTNSSSMEVQTIALQGLAQCGHWKESFSDLELDSLRFGDESETAKILMQLFSTLYEIGEINKADRLFQRAFFEAENISDAISQAATMLYIAERLVAVGSIDDALRVFDSAWYAVPKESEEIEDEEEYSKQTSSEWILKELYKVFGMSCSDYSCPNKKCWDDEVRLRIIETLLQSGDVEQAFQIANRVDNETSKEEILIRIALSQIALSLSIDETGIPASFNAEEKKIAATITKAFLQD